MQWAVEIKVVEPHGGIKPITILQPRKRNNLLFNKPYRLDMGMNTNQDAELHLNVYISMLSLNKTNSNELTI